VIGSITGASAIVGMARAAAFLYSSTARDHRPAGEARKSGKTQVVS